MVEGGEPTSRLIANEGGSANFVACDVSIASDVDRVVETAVTLNGRLDILVNNAAIHGAKPLLETDEPRWDHVMGVNLKGPYLCARAAIRQMLCQEIDGG